MRASTQTKLEKMAAEYDASELDGTNVHHTGVGPYGSAFIAGFRAAREMAAQNSAIHVQCKSCGAGDYVLNLEHLIRRLGEEPADE